MKDEMDIVERLRDCENDPMWANHAEIPKRWCKEAADEIERLRVVRDAAKVLVEECRPGISPSLGTLAKLEDALWALTGRLEGK